MVFTKSLKPEKAYRTDTPELHARVKVRMTEIVVAEDGTKSEKK